MSATGTVPRVGPNAITQMIETLRSREGEAQVISWLSEAGLPDYASTPPERMIPQSEARAAHLALRSLYPGEQGQALAREAGRRTADYLLAHRIPKPAQWILRCLPARPSLALLLKSISRHAWTFCGSGQFVFDLKGTPRVEIFANPLAMGPCVWHQAVFQRLFEVLVSRSVSVHEVACIADGSEACVFEIEF